MMKMRQVVANIKSQCDEVALCRDVGIHLVKFEAHIGDNNYAVM